MLLLQMRKEHLVCKSFFVITLLLVSSLQVSWTATTQPANVGLAHHQVGVATFAIPPTPQNQPSISQPSAPTGLQNSFALLATNTSSSSRFATTTTTTTPTSATTTTTTTPSPNLLAATSSKPAASSPAPPSAIFNVSPSFTATSTTSRPAVVFTFTTTSLPTTASASTTTSPTTIVSASTPTSATMISTTAAPATVTTTTTTVATTLASNLDDEFAPAYSTIVPDLPSSSPRPHNSNMELPNLETELQPNIPHLQRQPFDESTQHIPTHNSNNNNNNNDFAMEFRDNLFDSVAPSASPTTATPPPLSTTTAAVALPTPTQSPSLPDNSNFTTSLPIRPPQNDQLGSSIQLAANSTGLSQVSSGESRRLPDSRARAELQQPASNATSTLAKVQILRPNQKAKFKCSNHSDCRQGYCINGTCFCQPGFTGESCDINIDECRQFGGQPCSNNGTCIDDINGFRCECPVGFRGERCQDLADMCSESPCSNNATCINHRTHYTCKCEPGWDGQHCEIDIDDCAKNPCQNNATCHDQINGYRCSCLTGFMGPNCETNINDCALNPCQNNATCMDRVNDYECECPMGFAGKNCDENIDECASKPCYHGECLDLVNDFECNCEEGWTGKQCEQDVNECEFNRPVCANSGTCQNFEPSYKCLCREGYSGRNCNEITDYCKAKQPCSKYGSCKNINSVKGQYQCECQSGYIGNKCERKRDCFNECHSHHAHCVNNVTCACLPGRREERIMCEYVSSCQQVDGELCLNGGYCKNLDTGGYHCTCPDPFYGPICQFVAEKPQFDAFLFVVITCVGLLVVACAVVSLVLFRSVRKARATRGTYSPSTQEKHGNSASDLLKLPVPERLI